MAGRKATEQDLTNIKAWAILELCGRSDQGREALRQLDPAVREELYAQAADERQRRADGIVIY